MTGWIAPEVIEGGAPSTQSEVYSFGITLFEVSDSAYCSQTLPICRSAGLKPFIPNIASRPDGGTGPLNFGDSVASSKRCLLHVFSCGQLQYGDEPAKQILEAVKVNFSHPVIVPEPSLEAFALKQTSSLNHVALSCVRCHLGWV